MLQTTPDAGAAAAYDEWQERRWRLIGAVLVLLWLVTLASAIGTGERESNFAELQQAVADGSASQVEISGLPRGAGWQGSATVTLRWQGRFVARYVEVVVASSVTERDQASTPGGQLVVVGDPTDTLRAMDPELRITRTSGRHGPTWSQWGWQGPGWIAWPAGATLLGGFTS